MSYSRRVVTTIPLPAGKTTPLVVVNPAEQGTWIVEFSLDADTVLLSLFVESITGGSLDVEAFAVADEGKEISIIQFPTVSGPTGNLLLRKAAIALSRIRVVVTSSGPAIFDLRARGLSAGESTVKIVGASDLITSVAAVTTTPSSILPVTLTDRLGVVLRNWIGNTVYIAETAAKATPLLGYPLGAGESLGLDIQAGQEVWAATASGSSDIRIMEAGTI
jgi:hypothetical protein